MVTGYGALSLLALSVLDRPGAQEMCGVLNIFVTALEPVKDTFNYKEEEAKDVSCTKENSEEHQINEG